MSDSRAVWVGAALFTWILMASSLVAAQPSAPPFADLVCPGCPQEAALLTTTEVIRLMITTVFERGLSFLVVGATAAVGIPWIVAGIAIAVIYVPRWLKAS